MSYHIILPVDLIVVVTQGNYTRGFSKVAFLKLAVFEECLRELHELTKESIMIFDYIVMFIVGEVSGMWVDKLFPSLVL